MAIDAVPDIKVDAAVVVIAYNRPSHFEKVLTALIAEAPPAITVSFDAPEDKKSSDAQKTMKQFIEAQQKPKISVQQSEKHRGVAATVIESVNRALVEHEAVIVVEDDCVPQRGFLRYMMTTLAFYRSDKRVRSVCGYLPPFAVQPENSPVARASYRFIPWGWATWRDRWSEYAVSLEPLVQRIESELQRPLPFDLGSYISDTYFRSNKADIWSLSWSILHYLTGTLCIYPPASLVFNIGFDGSGVHSTATDVFSHRALPELPANIMLPKTFNTDYAFDSALNAFLVEHSCETMIKQVAGKFTKISTYGEKATRKKRPSKGGEKRGRKMPHR